MPVYHVLFDRIQVQHKRGRHANLRLVSVYTTGLAGAPCVNPVPKLCAFLALTLYDLLPEGLVMVRTTHDVVLENNRVKMATLESDTVLRNHPCSYEMHHLQGHAHGLVTPPVLRTSPDGCIQHEICTSGTPSTDITLDTRVCFMFNILSPPSVSTVLTRLLYA